MLSEGGGRTRLMSVVVSASRVLGPTIASARGSYPGDQLQGARF